ncbi:MAG: NAD(P)-dependent oxidoreductase [Terracidiphilus sp.]|jgi:nucleoside-diphosphate-sugar epimerase
MTIVAVGRSSFLAREAAKNPISRAWLFLSHDEALAQTGWLDDASTVVNFSFPNLFKTDLYDAQCDIDSMLARMIRTRPVHYVMLSSRMVYGQGDENFGLTESQTPKPSNFYGRSKLEVEQCLESTLGPSRLTVLRLSNIFGLERGRDSFFGRMMESLARSKKIIFDMGSGTQRDFFPAHWLSEALMQIAARPVAGVFNIGAGFATRCGDIASWLIEGYGAGRLEITNPAIRDQFSLDVSKARRTWNLGEFSPNALRETVVAFGKELKRAGSEEPRI